jgi:hypothetical protein
MTRATTVYLSMFVVLGVGLWAVLALGARLQAPADLSGYWEVRPLGETVPPVGEGLTVEQSGKYARVRFETGRRLDLKLAELARQGQGQDETVTARFTNDRWTLTFEGKPAENTARVTVRGRGTATFEARRTVSGAGAAVPEPEAPEPKSEGEEARLPVSPVTVTPVAATPVVGRGSSGPDDALQR